LYRKLRATVTWLIVDAYQLMFVGHSMPIQSSGCLLPPRRHAISAVCLSFCHSPKVISRFHWNLALWLGLSIGKTE